MHHLLLWQLHQCRNGCIVCHNKSTNMAIEGFNGRMVHGVGGFCFVLFFLNLALWLVPCWGNLMLLVEIQWYTIWAMVVLGFDFHLRSRFPQRLMLVLSVYYSFKNCFSFCEQNLLFQLWCCETCNFFYKHLPILATFTVEYSAALVMKQHT